MSSNLARKASRRKKQTRLTFDPIDPELGSSSPATKMSPAKVRYQHARRTTPSSSRNTYAVDDDESEDPLSASKKDNISKPAKGRGKAQADGRLPFKALPTPVKSSQSGSFSRVSGNNSSSAQNLSIDELSEDEELGNIIRSEHRTSARGNAFTRSTGATSSKKRLEVISDESDGSPPEDEIETPSRKSKGKQKAVSRTSRRGNSPHRISPFSSTSNLSDTKRTERRQRSVSLSSGTEDESVTHLPSKSQAGQASRDKSKSPADEDESDDLPLTSSYRRRIGLGTARDKRVARSTVNGSSKSQAIPVEGESDDDVVPSSAYRRRSRAVVLDDEQSGDEPLVSSPLKRGRAISEDSDESEILSSPRKRQKKPYRGHSDDSDIRSSPPKRTGRKDVEDSDIPSISETTSQRGAKSRISSSAPDRVTRQANVRKHRTAKEKQMELLKRRRAGEDIENLTDSSESSPEPKRGIYDSDSQHEMLDEFEDESEPEVVQKPKRKSNTNDYHLSEDSDFVVEDDEDDALGVPLGLLDIPLQFRHAAHKPMKEHFKDAIEWMVHRKINPGFNRTDEIYLQAFLKLDDEYQGYAKSKFVSTQWTAEFTRAIYARPILIERPCASNEGYTLDGLPKCDVCNHRKHIPTFAIRFEGKAYSKATLDEVESQEGSDDSESDESVSVNSKGHSLPAEDIEWFSGIVCRENAQQAHALIHWKYALNEWVLDQLETEGHLTPDKLAKRDKMKSKKRRAHANDLVDGWENTGIIKNLYRDFKTLLAEARNSKQGRWDRGKFQGFGVDDD